MGPSLRSFKQHEQSFLPAIRPHGALYLSLPASTWEPPGGGSASPWASPCPTCTRAFCGWLTCWPQRWHTSCRGLACPEMPSRSRPGESVYANGLGRGVRDRTSPRETIFHVPLASLCLRSSPGWLSVHGSGAARIVTSRCGFTLWCEVQAARKPTEQASVQRRIDAVLCIVGGYGGTYGQGRPLVNALEDVAQEVPLYGVFGLAQRVERFTSYARGELLRACLVVPS